MLKFLLPAPKAQTLAPSSPLLFSLPSPKRTHSALLQVTTRYKQIRETLYLVIGTHETQQLSMCTEPAFPQ